MLSSRLGFIGRTLILMGLFLCTACMSGPQQKPGMPMRPADFIIMTVYFTLTAVVIWWMMVWKPRQEREERQRKFIDELKKGDEVVTSGGIVGRVVSVKPGYVTIEVSPGTRLKVQSLHVLGPAPEDEQGAQGQKEK